VVVVVVVARVMVMRCAGGVESRRGALARRRNRRRALVTGGSPLAGGVLRVEVSDDEVDGHLVRSTKLCAACQLDMLQEAYLEGVSSTFCSPKTSNKVSLSRLNSLPWWIKRCCSLDGFASKASRIFSFSWPTVVEAGRPVKFNGALTASEGEMIEMLTVGGFSPWDGALDEEGTSSAMTNSSAGVEVVRLPRFHWHRR